MGWKLGSEAQALDASEISAVELHGSPATVGGVATPRISWLGWRRPSIGRQTCALAIWKLGSEAQALDASEISAVELHGSPATVGGVATPRISWLGWRRP